VPNPFVYDTFTGTNGTQWNAHTGETGATWTFASTSGTVPDLFSNALTIHTQVVGITQAYASGVPNSADYELIVDIGYDSTTTDVAVLYFYARYADGSNHYFGSIDTSGNATIQKKVGGTSTSLGSNGTAGVATGDEWKFRVQGTTLTLFRNGTAVVGPLTDSAITAANKVALAGQCATVGNGHNAFAIDTFTAQDVPAGVALAAGVVSIANLASGTATLASTNVAGGTTPYSIQWKRSPDGTTYSNIGSAQTGSTGPVTNFTDSGLTDGSRYWYKYTATDSAGSPASVDSNVVIVVPHPPLQTFYCDPVGGNDTNNGMSTGAPWQTATRCSNYLAASIRPGDSLAINGGTTLAGNLTAGPSGATVANPFLLTSYGTGQATVSAGNGSGLVATDPQWFRTRNLTFTGSGVSSAGVTTNTGSGVVKQLTGAADVQGAAVLNCNISGFGVNGINFTVANGNTHYFDGPLAQGNTVSACGNAGITSGYGGIYGTRFRAPLVTKNSVSNIYGTGGNTGYGIQLVNWLGGTCNQNYVSSCGGASSGSSGGPTGIILAETNGALVSANEVYAQKTGDGGDGQGIDCDAGAVNNVIEKNYISGCDGPAFMTLNLGGSYQTTTGNVFRWNVAQNNGRRSTNHSAGTGPNPCTVFVNRAAGSQFYNNTVYDTQATNAETQSFYGTQSDGVYRDNIILTAGAGQTIGTFTSAGVTLQGNTYYASGGSTFSITINAVAYTSLASLQGAGYEKVGAAAVGSAANPSLANIGGAGHGYPLGNFATLTAYDPTNATAAAGGLDLAGTFGVAPGVLEFHGNAVHDPATGTYPVGAVRAAASVGGAGGVATFINGGLITGAL
jgi:hypothetical protein